MLIDPVKCPHTVVDFEDVVPKEGTMEIDKIKNAEISHHSDGVGYFCEREYSIARSVLTSQPL